MTSSLAQFQLLGCALNRYDNRLCTIHNNYTSFCDCDDSVCFQIISHHGLAHQNEIANLHQ